MSQSDTGVPGVQAESYGDKSVEKFLENPHAYEFFQAIRILARRLDLRDSDAGLRFDTRNEPVRVGAHTSLSFPASDIQSVAVPADGGVPEIRINMLGLTGVAGVLPQYYTQLLIEQRAAGETSLDDFLNIFNHRFAYLYYYAWEKYRFPAAFDRTGADPLLQILLALAGVPPAPLPLPGGTRTERDAETGETRVVPVVPAGFFARFASLLALQPRSGEALRTILAEYFEVEVDVQQYAGAWHRLEGRSLTRLDEKDGVSTQLGYGVVAGEDYWSLDSMVRIRIGPLENEVFAKLLPGREWHQTLAEICRFFARDEFVFEVQLVLKEHGVSRCVLDSDAGMQLGWTTWMHSRPRNQLAEYAAALGVGIKVDPDDVIFRL